MIMPKMVPIPIKTKCLNSCKALYTWITKTREWEIIEDYDFYIERIDKWVVIPKGFVFDGASVPRPFWWLFNPSGILLLPGLIHDYAYKYGHLLMRDTQYKNNPPLKVCLSELKRLDWDFLFKEIAVQVNGFKIINELPYIAIVLFGWITWNKYRDMNLKDGYS